MVTGQCNCDCRLTDKHSFHFIQHLKAGSLWSEIPGASPMLDGAMSRLESSLDGSSVLKHSWTGQLLIVIEMMLCGHPMTFNAHFLMNGIVMDTSAPCKRMGCCAVWSQQPRMGRFAHDHQVPSRECGCIL